MTTPGRWLRTSRWSRGGRRGDRRSAGSRSRPRLKRIALEALDVHFPEPVGVDLDTVRADAHELGDDADELAHAVRGAARRH